MMIRRLLEDWCVSESKRAGVPMTPSWTCRPRVAADADAATAVATQAAKAATRTTCLARNRRDHGRHERHSRGPRRERHVEDLDGAPAVESLHGRRARGEAGRDRPVDGVEPFDRVLADSPVEQPFERRPEDLACRRVSGDIAPLLVPDEEADARRAEGLGDELGLDL